MGLWVWFAGEFNVVWLISYLIMDFVKIMWISGFLENSVLNGCLLVFFFN